MILSTLRGCIAVVTFGFIFSAVALGQNPQDRAWESAQRNIAAKEKVYVVTIAHPKRRNLCVVQSIGLDKIVCTHPGHTRVFRAGDVAALIERGEHTRWQLYFAGVLAAGGAATWGTVVLASVCPVCAVATGVAALFLYVVAPLTAMLTEGDSGDSLLYLAEGQHLQVRLN